MMLPLLNGSQVIRRFPGNPILCKKDIPYDSELIFNAGVAKYQGQYVMVFRNDYGYSGGNCFEGTNLGFATSPDGIQWTAAPTPCWKIKDQEISRVYDPRLTVLEGKMYICFAMDTRHGLRGGIACTEDFYRYDILSLSIPDNRNMVLFPEKIGGRYIRLERPFTVYSRGNVDRFDTWMSASPDLIYWGNSSLVLAVEDVPFANDKIGPAAPPVKTPKGWLTLFHAVDIDKTRGKNGWEDSWQKRYTVGIMLLDTDDPSRVIGMSKSPLLAPQAPYELNGFRSDVIFPGGMILEDSGEVKIYYGASDTVECLATADVGDLLALCIQKR